MRIVLTCPTTTPRSILQRAHGLHELVARLLVRHGGDEVAFLLGQARGRLRGGLRGIGVDGLFGLRDFDVVCHGVSLIRPHHVR